MTLDKRAFRKGGDMTKTEELRTEQLRKEIDAITRSLWRDGYESRGNNVREFRNGKLPLERIEEADTQILQVCKEAGLAFVVKNQSLTEVPLHYYKWREAWFDAQKELRDKAGYKKTEEIELKEVPSG